MKKITSLSLGFSFLIMSYTGVVLYIAPHGRIARWLDWHFLGLDKTQYQEVHITSMVLFLVFGILHIYYNWKPIVSYLKDVNKKISFTKKEFLIALLLNTIFVVGTLLSIQPFQGILDFSEDIKKSWGKKSIEFNNNETKFILPPPQQLGRKTLEELEESGHIDLEESIELLKSKGLDDVDSHSRIRFIANELDLTPTDIYKLLNPINFMKILYLEDDIDLSETIEEFLNDKDYNVVCVYDGDEALEVLYRQNFDLLILDVQVPKINGFELLQNLRDANIQTPAIFTTSLNSIEDLSKGYSVGADDYIKKPFALKELHLRIEALLKREYKTQEYIIKLDENITYNINLQQIQIDGKKYVLNHKENELLKLLVKNKNSCVLFDIIFENIWSYDETHNEQSLRTYIKNLRKIVGKNKIISIKKQGYMFV